MSIFLYGLIKDCLLGPYFVSETSVHCCVYALCRAILFKLLKQFISLPDVSETQATVHCNSTTYLVPRVYRALDGTRILILPPSDGQRDYSHVTNMFATSQLIRERCFHLPFFKITLLRKRKKNTSSGRNLFLRLSSAWMAWCSQHVAEKILGPGISSLWVVFLFILKVEKRYFT